MCVNLLLFYVCVFFSFCRLHVYQCAFEYFNLLIQNRKKTENVKNDSDNERHPSNEWSFRLLKFIERKKNQQNDPINVSMQIYQIGDRSGFRLCFFYFIMLPLWSQLMLL